MTRHAPSMLLAGIRLGQTRLDKKHASLAVLWKRFRIAFRAERKARKLRRKEFAYSMGITPTYLSYLESGTKPWNMKRAEQAVKLLTRQAQWPD